MYMQSHFNFLFSISTLFLAQFQLCPLFLIYLMYVIKPLAPERFDADYTQLCFVFRHVDDVASHLCLTLSWKLTSTTPETVDD